MIKTVEGVGQIINIGADPVGGKFSGRAGDHALEAGKLQHQGLLVRILRGKDGKPRKASALLSVFFQDGLDADDGVKDIRAGVPFKGGEAVHVEYIILRRLVGKVAVLQGGQAHDVIALIRKYGIVPEEAYTGLHYGRDFHLHAELVAALKGILNGVNANPNKQITPTWTDGFRAYIDSYLGAAPDTFTYQGQEYTPRTFAESLGLDLDDYVEITSYEAFPFYQEVELPIPDNWMHARYHNVPLDDLVAIMRHALRNGYTVCWDGDVSHNGFSHASGLAILPTDNPEEMINSEISKWTTLSADERRSKLRSFTEPVPEMKIDDARRQAAFDSRLTTDDHLMHLTGLLKDQNGTYYYKTKNSWAGDSNPFGGYLYMSEPYVRLQTVAIMVHRDAIPKDIRKKLGL